MNVESLHIAMSSLDAGPQRPGNDSISPPALEPITLTLNSSATASESTDGGGEKGKSLWTLLVLAETHAVYPLLIAAGLLCNSLAIVTLRQRNLRTNLTYFRCAHLRFCQQVSSFLYFVRRGTSRSRCRRSRRWGVCVCVCVCV